MPVDRIQELKYDERTGGIEAGSMKLLYVATLAFLLPLWGGCTSYLVAPRPVHRTHRTFRAPYRDVFKASLQSLGDVSLASVDSQSGVIITDWMKGNSDVRYVRKGGRAPRPLRTMYKIIVRVEETGAGVRVRVKPTEYTVYPEVTYTRWPAAPHLRMTRGFPPHHIPDWGGHYEKRDRYVVTPSSTAKEKIILDRIESLLRSYYKSQ
jgi:hypothetical protein